MKTILFIIQKEFKQIFRDKSMLQLIFILPILQLLILSNAATFDVKNVAITFVDNDQSRESRDLINSFKSSTYFKVTEPYFSEKEAIQEMQKGKTDIIVNIPIHFNRDLQKDQKTSERRCKIEPNKQRHRCKQCLSEINEWRQCPRSCVVV